MGVFRSTTSPRRESDAEETQPLAGRLERRLRGRQCVRVGGRWLGKACVWCVGSGWLAVTRQWVLARDDDDERDRLTWTLPSFLPCSLFSSTPTHAPAANLPRGRGTE